MRPFTLSKILLPALAAMSLNGCVYEEVSYAQPRRVYHSGYAPRDVVVVQRGPSSYYDRPHAYPYHDGRSRGYYQQPRARTYYDRPYASGVYVDHHRSESWKERQRREIREAQRAGEKHKDKKKKKKDDDDD